MKEEFHEYKNLQALVNQVVYVPYVGDPPDRPYGFVYYITIQNNTVHTVDIQARKWVVREANGEVLVVEGEGVVGEKPHLEPGESFTYNSCHVVGSDAEVSGAFYGTSSAGHSVRVVIPSFSLEVPQEG